MSEEKRLVNYAKLIDDISLVLTQAKTDIALVLVETNWAVGKRLSEDTFVTENKRIALDRIAKDLDVSATQLARCIQFYKAWPQVCPSTEFSQLTWSHYRELLPVSNNTQRRGLARQAQDEKLSVRDLKSIVRSSRGTIDAEDRRFDEGALSVLMRRETNLHACVARLDRVVDGDTIDVNIDLGYSIWTTQRLRLRGIDCPEAGTKEGDASTQFTCSQLAGCETFVIQTFKTDLYGRYVADVLYLPGAQDKEVIFKEGRFLNAELAASGHARVV